MKISIKQLSEMSGFSPATVSNVLNGKKGVNKDTAELIMKLARESGYLSENRMTSIKLVVYKKHGWVLSDTPFFSSLTEGINEECRASGYDTVICNLNEHSEDFESHLEQILSDPNSGILLLATEMGEEDVKAFHRAVAPLVVLDASFEQMDFDTVLINNTDSVSNAVGHLIKMGHREIGYLKSSMRIQNFRYREAGYRRAHEEAEIAVNPAFTVELTPTMEGAYKDMARFLERNPQLPTAYFADNDIIALGAMKALKEAGCRIPEDISIIGFDDIALGQSLVPGLTTIRQDMRLKAERTCDILLRHLDAPKSPSESQILDVELIERESVKTLS